MEIKQAIAAIPMVNVERAKQFYGETLGFTIKTLSEDLNMYYVLVANNFFLLYLRNEKSKAEHTSLSLTVENIEMAIAQLEHKGISFYEDKGAKIFDLDGSLSSWFKDSEGNNLEISERSY